MGILLNVNETRWSFYECAENEDIENMSSYFETLYHHYQNRGKRIKLLNKVIAELRDTIDNLRLNNRVI